LLQLTSEGYHAKDGSKGRIGDLYCDLEFGVMQELVATMLLLQYVKETLIPARPRQGAWIRNIILWFAEGVPDAGTPKARVPL